MAREYRIYHANRGEEYIVCDAKPPEAELKRYEVAVNVTAPPKAVHEAFFDPVAMGSAVGADADDGVLDPSEFDVGSTYVSMHSLAWESGSVEMGASGSAHAVLADHHIDFIELDGTVGLRLDFDDASETALDDGSSVLSWEVCDQPWESGDLLMIRVSESDADFSGATSDAWC